MGWKMMRMGFPPMQDRSDNIALNLTVGPLLHSLVDSNFSVEMIMPEVQRNK